MDCFVDVTTNWFIEYRCYDRLFTLGTMTDGMTVSLLSSGFALSRCLHVDVTIDNTFY